MKKNKLILKYAKIMIILMIVIISACKDDSFNVPEASTQAKFKYSWEVVTIDSVPNYKVTFENQSILAESCFWDFGNGQTSTEQNPVAYFTEEASYKIKLTVTSKSSLHYSKLQDSTYLRVIFKETMFSENFNKPEYETDFPLPGWKMTDADGDGNNWYCNYFADDANGYLLSRSYLDPNSLTPDNWLITPQIDLTSVSTGKVIKLEFFVCPTAKTPIYKDEHYSILVSTTGTEISDFTEIYSETLASDMVNWVYLLRECILDNYAGQKIYLAFRHHNCTDNDRISIDDIEVYFKY